MPKLYQNSTGVNIDLDTQLDIATLATATSVQIVVSRPDQTTTNWTADIVAGTSKIRHTIVSGDLTLAGSYILQASVTFSASSTVVGDAVKMKVYALFQ